MHRHPQDGDTGCHGQGAAFDITCLQDWHGLTWALAQMTSPALVEAESQYSQHTLDLCKHQWIPRVLTWPLLSSLHLWLDSSCWSHIHSHCSWQHLVPAALTSPAPPTHTEHRGLHRDSQEEILHESRRDCGEEVQGSVRQAHWPSVLQATNLFHTCVSIPTFFLPVSLPVHIPSSVCIAPRPWQDPGPSGLHAYQQQAPCFPAVPW